MRLSRSREEHNEPMNESVAASQSVRATVTLSIVISHNNATPCHLVEIK